MKKLFLIGIIFIVIGAGGLLLTGVSFSTDEEKKIVEERMLEGDINTVEIDIDIGKVTVTESERDNIVVHYEGTVPTDQFTFEAESNGNRAQIVAKSKPQIFSFPFISSNWNAKRELLVELPKRGMEKVVIHGDVAAIYADTEHVATLEAKSDTGKMSIEKFHGEQLTLRSDVGSIFVVEASGGMDIQTDTGNIDLTVTEVTNHIRLKSDVGQIDVKLQQVPDALGLDIASDVGPVSVANLKGFDQFTGSPIRAFKGEGGPILDVKTDVGSITVR